MFFSRSLPSRVFPVCGLLAAVACADVSSAPVTEPTPDGAVGAATDSGARGDAKTGSAADAGSSPVSLDACAAMGGATPATIADVVARINALPAPATIACLVASLPRPLSVVATTSPSSAQPAGGSDSPRLFIVSDTLTLSVVAGGHAENLLEFGQFVTPLRSIKAELAWPLERRVTDADPYQRVLQPKHAISVCGLCHANETPHESIPNAFVSDALRVATYYEKPISEVRALRDGCTKRRDESDARCDILRALFDYGEVREGAFDDAIKQGF